jgi:hypothetical protein
VDRRPATAHHRQPILARPDDGSPAPAALRLCTLALPAVAHDVIPEHHTEAVQRLLADGPKETRSVEPTAEIGSVPLDGELPGAEGKVLRAPGALRDSQRPDLVRALSPRTRCSPSGSTAC